MEVGLKFSSFKAARAAICDYEIKTHQNFVNPGGQTRLRAGALRDRFAFRYFPFSVICMVQK